MSASTRAQIIEKVRHLLNEMKVCMMTTVRPNGSLHRRPMVMQEVEFDGDLWFFMARDTEKAAEIETKRFVNVSARSDDQERFVSLSGRGTIVEDPAKAAQLWKPSFLKWFPGGLADPQLALLRVEAETAEYWDTPGGVAAYLANFAASLTGDQHTAPTQNEAVAL